MIKKKTRTPRKKTKVSTNIQKLKVINYILLFLVLALSTVLITYYYSQKQTPKIEKKPTPTAVVKKEPVKIPDIQLEQKIDDLLNGNNAFSSIDTHAKNSKKNFEEYTEELEKEYVHEVIKKEETAVETKVVKPKSTRPKLAIVIDDVTMQSQVNNINSIDYTVNMSFLPPSALHPNSAKIAHNLPFYMIHFPMEATSFKFEEIDTLHIGDSYEKIEQRVKKLKELYPKAKFTNNHTGSKFTADADSMEKLFRALKKYEFSFLDSRTTAKTVAKEYAKKYDVPFVGRNIFLDNNLEYEYILNQLKKAIKIANKTGYAIAIGHPHEMTVKVLREAKILLKDLDLVYLNEIPVE
ncbi:MAG: divergent polysaccharide deacetylase family protein [Arcobacteraceae bacterium]